MNAKTQAEERFSTENVIQESGEKTVVKEESEGPWAPFRTEGKYIGVIALLILCISCLINALEILYMFDPQVDSDSMRIAFLVTVLPRILFYIGLGIKSASFSKFIQYLAILDPIAFSMGLAVYSFVVLLVSVFELSAVDYIVIILLCVKFMTYAACHRSVVAELKWRRWQIYLYKLILFFIACFYVVYGVRFIFPRINWTGGKDEKLDKTIREFIVLYIIGSADFVVLLYEKLCDLDKTADLKIQNIANNTIYKLNTELI